MKQQPESISAWSARMNQEAEMQLERVVRTTDGKEFISPPQGNKEGVKKKRYRDYKVQQDAIAHQKTLRYKRD